MEYILYVFMVTAAAGVKSSGGIEVHQTWRPNGEFTSQTSCETGARQLGYTSANFKCIKK